MTVRGTPNADALNIAQIEVDYLQNPVKVRALAALVNEGTGATVAWTEGSGGVWSQETLTKLRELIESMENDLANKVFLDGASVAAPAIRRANPGLIAGLGEHVGGEDAPSI